MTPMPDKKLKSKVNRDNIAACGPVTDKTVLRTIGLSGGHHWRGRGAVDVKDGKIVRIRPLHYDWKYDRQALIPGNSRETARPWNPTGNPSPVPILWPIKKESIRPTVLNIP